MPKRPAVVPQKLLPRLVSLEAAADYLNVSTKTVRRYISRGHLTGYRMGPRLLRIDLDEMDALMRRIPTGGDLHGAA